MFLIYFKIFDVLVYDIIVSDFEFQKRYSDRFWANIQAKI